MIKAGRKDDKIKLLAVSKFHPAESVIEAIKAGQKLFGENRVQEADKKFSEKEENFNNIRGIAPVGINNIDFDVIKWLAEYDKPLTPVNTAHYIVSLYHIAELYLEVEPVALHAVKKPLQTLTSDVHPLHQFFV